MQHHHSVDASGVFSGPVGADLRAKGVAIPDSAVIEMSSLTKKHQIAKAMSEQVQQADPVVQAKADDLRARIDEIEEWEGLTAEVRAAVKPASDTPPDKESTVEAAR